MYQKCLLSSSSCFSTKMSAFSQKFMVVSAILSVFLMVFFRICQSWSTLSLVHSISSLSPSSELELLSTGYRLFTPSESELRESTVMFLLLPFFSSCLSNFFFCSGHFEGFLESFFFLYGSVFCYLTISELLVGES